ncbi:MAG TPA: PilZ domain-containing protein [Gammaproteobacteria bacterium]|nr:PilZ domain-containing protein [Gammaproteobacteria bacterium]
MREDEEKRWFTRVSWSAPASLVLPGSTLEVDCLNISLNGALLRAASAPPEDTTGRLLLPLDTEGENRIEAECRILRPEGGTFAVEFTGYDLDSAAHLRNLLAYNTAEPERIDQELPNLRRSRRSDSD